MTNRILLSVGLLAAGIVGGVVIASTTALHVSPSFPYVSTTAHQFAFKPRTDDQIPKTPFGDMVRLGENIFRDPQTYAAKYVGNDLHCTNCHLQAGRLAGASPMWAAYTAYPAYRSKNGHVNSYQERLQGCFRYSMNGQVPPLGDPVLVALES